MSKALKITPTLINSFNAIFEDFSFGNAPTESAKKSEEEFLKLLRKEPIGTSEAKEYGIKFENLCYNGIVNENTKEIVEIIQGGTFQVRREKLIFVNGIRFKLVGVADVVKGAYIYDIKTTTYYNAPKFIESAQTSAYLSLFPNATQFGYLVHDHSTQTPHFYSEYYTRSQVQPIETFIFDFIKGLQTYGYWDEYVKNWTVDI